MHEDWLEFISRRREECTGWESFRKQTSTRNCLPWLGFWGHMPPGTDPDATLRKSWRTTRRDSMQWAQCLRPNSGWTLALPRWGGGCWVGASRTATCRSTDGLAGSSARFFCCRQGDSPHLTPAIFRTDSGRHSGCLQRLKNSKVSVDQRLQCSHARGILLHDHDG